MSRIEELEKRLAADPSSRIFVQLAEEYRKQGLLENAIEICEQGLTKHPQYPSARVALGRALLEAETFDRASEEFEAVLAQVPDNILANKFLGETYHRLGRYDEAIQKYQIAQTLAPEDTELEGKIEAVKAEKAGGGPPPPAVANAAAPSGTDAPLEATLVDAPAAAPDVSQAPPPMPDMPAKPDAPPPSAPAASATPAPAEEEPPAADEPPDEPAELAPIPLADIDEPMVLESPSEFYARAGEPVAADADPPEPVPLVSPTEPPPLEPAPMEPPPMEPPAMEPSPEPAALEPPPMEPAAFEPPPSPLLEAPEAVPVPVVEEPLPVEPLPVEPLPVEPAAPPEPAAEPPPASDDIETPTMAELYASQGHFDKAVLVYRNLLTRDPNETQYLERIEELEMLANATADSTTAAPAATGEARGDGLSESKRQQTIEVLEQWLEGIRGSRGA